MNLIVDEQKLDRQQERAIYELTLKKQRSKKSTVSHKQVAAMQQLANELVTQRKSSLEMLDLNNNNNSSERNSANSTSSSSPSQRYHSFRTTMCRCQSTSTLGENPAANLEQLHIELERRLHQYEYLVAQEKAILGSYNLNLFANESVNNFHLFSRMPDQKNLVIN